MRRKGWQGLVTAGLLVAFAASAQEKSFDLPAQDAVKALPEFARQAGVQIIAPTEQLKGLQTPALKGTLDLHDALTRLLAGTGLTVMSDDGKTIILSLPRKSSAIEPTTDYAAAGAEEITVTGSHIPRARIEGPAPVSVVTAKDIQARGFSDTASIMQSLSQNIGSVDNNTNTDGFTPGAQAIDLRGLGPNHTLVLVNGRRIADYPQAYNGNSNFTDISNIPSSMIDRVEILTGTASAIYGSDAISGVVNFIMKQKADGTTADFRYGDTQHGGGRSERLQVTSGYSDDKIDSMFGIEFSHTDPVWAYQRSFTNSRLDSPGAASSLFADPVFVRQDVNGNYIDPGAATCQALSRLDQGSIVYAYRKNYGNYCGSYRDVGYGTLENGKTATNFYGTGKIHLTDNLDFFADLQMAKTQQQSYNSPLQWTTSYLLNENQTDTPFFNQATGQIEQWQRKFFTIEENGGFSAGEIHMSDFDYSLNTGLKGSLPGTDWHYEALFGQSSNHLENKEPALIAAKAQALYLGPALGVDPASGLTIYNAPVSNLYTPLTVAQFRSITQDSIDRDTASATNVTLTVDNPALFSPPTGDVGVAAVAEYGHQYFGVKADPMSLDGSYYGLHNTSSVGSRDHFGGGLELSIPIYSDITLSGAGRYDSYSYSSTDTGKLTYSAGVEYRPLDSLLLRASYGTGFRAPDLSYLYAGLSGSSSSGVDYYLCRRDEAGTAPDFADNCTNGDIGFDGRSHGSTALKDETSDSFTYGLVFSPSKSFDVTADYYQIHLNNEVEYQSSDTILREEADCRLGQTQDGQAVNIGSALCQQVISQVVRNPATAFSSPEAVTSVMVLPINAAVERTSGMDLSVHFKLDAQRYGAFDFNVAGTYVFVHKIQLFAGDPVVNEFSDLYDYVIPRWKANESVTWSIDDFATTLYVADQGPLPNYDGTKRMGPTYIANGTVNYRFTEKGAVTLTVDNLLDTKPGNGDPTWTSYPYYPSRWFSPIGRSFMVEFNYRFGG